MKRKVYYRYNPQTLTYDRIYPSRKDRIIVVFRHLISGIVVGIVGLIAVTYFFDTPWDKAQKKEDELIRAQYEVLSKRMDEVISVIGWVNWSRKKEDDYVFPISYCSPKEWLSGTAVFLLTLVTLVSVLHHYTDSNTVIADSLVSAAAATAMWWMARRKIESWYAWTVSNLVAIPLFYIKGLHFTVAQYILFLVLAIWGYFTWKNEWNKEHAYRKT